MTKASFFKKLAKLGVISTITMTAFWVIGATEQKPAIKDASADLQAIQKKLTDGKPMIWVTTGDSITHGAMHTHGWRSYPEHIAERVRGEMRRFRDVIINTGISGNKTNELLADFQWRVLQFKPDVVSIMYGMNDAAKAQEGREIFRTNLKEIVKKIREAGAIPVLNTTNTICSVYAKGREDLPSYNQIIAEVAKEDGVILVDHWSHWKKCQPQEGKMMVWMNDDIHPNGYGHIEFAKEIFKTLNIYDVNSPTCQLYVPAR